MKNLDVNRSFDRMPIGNTGSSEEGDSPALLKNIWQYGLSLLILLLLIFSWMAVTGFKHRREVYYDENEFRYHIIDKNYWMGYQYGSASEMVLDDPNRESNRCHVHNILGRGFAISEKSRVYISGVGYRYSFAQLFLHWFEKGGNEFYDKNGMRNLIIRYYADLAAEMDGPDRDYRISRKYREIVRDNKLCVYLDRGIYDK